MKNLLEIENLSVTFGRSAKRRKKDDRTATVVEGLGFFLAPGETLGIVGESGSGKSVTSLAIMGLLPPDNSHVQGEIRLEEQVLTRLSEKEMREIRGNKIAMIFQEPMTSLNPIIPCGKQIMEPLLLHTGMTRQQAEERAMELLVQCGIPAPEARFHEYPHQMSGGMRQRIMIALALACDPKLLIADEPTTALDVTVQAQILDLLKEIKAKSAMSTIMVTHDLGIVRDFCDKVIIMYCGQIVESAGVADIFDTPRHPYTRGLLSAIPKLSDPMGKRLEAIEGMVPDIGSLPGGCRFHPRCPHAFDRCRQELPELVDVRVGHRARCFLCKEVPQ